METDYYFNIDEVEEELEQTPDKKLNANANQKRHKVQPFNYVIMDEESQDHETPPNTVVSENAEGKDQTASTEA